MADFDVLGLGVAVRDVTVLLDTFPTPDEKYRAKGFYESSGGPVPTALVTLARLGRRVAFRGIVGDDAVGEFIIDDLRREGVDVSGVVRKKRSTVPEQRHLGRRWAAYYLRRLANGSPALAQ